MGSNPLVCRPIPITQPIAIAREEAENLSEREESILRNLGLETELEIKLKLEEFLDKVLREIEAEKPRSRVLILRAPWGYGKTYYGKVVLRELALKRRIWHRYITFEEIVETVRQSLERGTSKNINREAREYLKKLLNDTLSEAIRNNCKAAILFIDELEAFLEALRVPRGHRLRADTALVLIDELLNMIKLLMHSEVQFYSELRGKVHLVLGLTPEAHNIIQQFAKERGIEGRLARREEVLSILPMTKIDAFRLAKALLSEVYRLPRGSIPPGIINMLYIVSGGNPSVFIKLLNNVILNLYERCKYEYNYECICSLEDPMYALNVLKNIEISYAGERAHVSRIIDEGFALLVERIKQSNQDLASIMASLVVFTKPIPLDKLLLPSDVFSLNLVSGYNLYYTVNVYRMDTEEFKRWFDAKVEQLANELGEDRSIIRRALAALTFCDDEEVLVILPEQIDKDFDEVNYIFASQGVSITRDLIERLDQELKERTSPVKAIALRPSAYPIIYPSVLLTAIPFIRDPIVARKLLRELEDLLRGFLEEFYDYLVKGFKEVLINQQLLNAKDSTIGINAYGIEYAVPLEISALSSESMVGSHHRKIVRNKPLIRIVLIPVGLGSSGLHYENGSFELRLELSPLLMKMIAAIGYAKERDEYRRYLDEEKLSAFCEKVVNELRIQEYLERIGKMLEGKGIAVPPLLRGMTEKMDLSTMLNGYRILLLGRNVNNVVELNELADILLSLYRIRPYKLGRKLEWCGVPVPKLLMLDLEPKDPRTFYSSTRLEKYKEHVLDEMRKIAEALSENGLLEKIDNDKYKFTIHPIECRILEVLREIAKHEGKKSIDVNELMSYFVFPSIEEYRLSAIKLFKAFFLELLRFKGSIIREKDTIRLTPYRHDYMSLLKSDLEKEVRDLEEYRRKIMHYIGERICKLCQGYGINIDTSTLDECLSIVLVKEYGVKIIAIKDIIDVARKILERPTLVPETIEEFSDMIRGYKKLLESVILEIEGICEEYLKIAHSIRTSIKSLHGVVVEELGFKEIEFERYFRDVPNELDLCESFAEALRQMQDVLNYARKFNVDHFKERYKEIYEKFRFDACSNEFRFNLFLYVVKKLISDRLEKLRKAEKKLSEIEETLRNLANIFKGEDVKVSDIISLGRRKVSTLEELEVLVMELEERARGIEEKLSKCKELKKAIEENIKNIFQELHNLETILDEAKEYSMKLHRMENIVLAMKNFIHDNILERYYNEIKGYEEDLRKIINEDKEQKRRIIDKVSDIDRNLQYMKCDEIIRIGEEFKRELQVMASNIEDMIGELSKMKDRVARLCSDFREWLKNIILTPLINQLHMLEGILKNLKNISMHIAVKKKLEDVQLCIKQLQELVNLESDRPMDIINLKEKTENLLNDVTVMLRQEIERDVGVQGYEVLTKIFELRKNKVRLRLSELVQEIAKSLGIDPKDVAYALVDLDRKGYISLDIVLLGISSGSR